MATKKATEKEIAIELNMKTIRIPIVGKTPLIVHRFSEKAGKQLKEIAEAEKGLKQGGKKKNIADPQEDYLSSLYFFPDGKRTGFPAGAFKDAMVIAAYRLFNRPQTVMRTAFFVNADNKETNLVEIKGEHKMREDMVRVGGIQKVASPRYRACYPEWSAELEIEFMTDILSEEDIVKLVAAAGNSCGIGEWRPEKCNSGDFGRFCVANQ